MFIPWTSICTGKVFLDEQTTACILTTCNSDASTRNLKYYNNEPYSSETRYNYRLTIVRVWASCIKYMHLSSRNSKYVTIIHDYYTWLYLFLGIFLTVYNLLSPNLIPKIWGDMHRTEYMLNLAVLLSLRKNVAVRFLLNWIFARK